MNTQVLGRDNWLQYFTYLYFYLSISVAIIILFEKYLRILCGVPFIRRNTVSVRKKVGLPVSYDFFQCINLIQNLIVNLNLCHTLGSGSRLSPIRMSESWSVMKIKDRQNTIQNQGCYF